ncbi:MAG: PAS domain-containing protein [Alphaproteobacteria bacterium]|nr:PAS domain-containing protein [Alphaproteobacteria bacterium]
MSLLPSEIAPFLEAWNRLPRGIHPTLPQKKDINPIQFGEFLHLVCITELVCPRNLQIRYAGSEFERLAGFTIELKNYYDMLPPQFVDTTEQFHSRLMGTPCGAYVSDMITSGSGSSYLHQTVHLPLSDEKGEVRYLLIYGFGNKPVGDHEPRRQGNHNARNIKELHYLDLGTGAPAAYVSNFEFHKAG